MILGVPCYENQYLTAQLVRSLAETVTGDVSLVIVDNASPHPYRAKDFDYPLTVIRNERNEGNFYPLGQVAETGTDEIVALIHNDMIVYERGWDVRLAKAFEDDPLLGLVGFAGSYAIDAEGLRAPGTTMSNLRGERGHVSAEGAGTRITDLRPSVAVDGLFMAFRRGTLSSLTLDASLPPAHFYDYIWGAQVLRAGWHQATLGIDCDHVGWSTEVGLAKELDGEWRRWARDNRVDAGEHVMDAIWRVARDRWLAYNGSFWPCSL